MSELGRGSSAPSSSELCGAHKKHNSLDRERISFQLVNTATVGVHERERSESPGGHLVGRPGLDPGTLRVFPERPPMSISVQLCWSDEVECPPTSTEVHSRVTSWLDNWLDPGSFQGEVAIQFRESDGEGYGDGYDQLYFEYGKD